MIEREMAPALRKAAQGYPVIAITGPRQSGKTTLSRSVFPDKAYISLEDPDQLDFALSDPRRFLGGFPRGAILDEVQRAPDLFSYIQGIVDERQEPGLFVLTGSQHFGLLAGISQTLAGRVALFDLLPFSFAELQAADVQIPSLDHLLFTGQYPPCSTVTLIRLTGTATISAPMSNGMSVRLRLSRISICFRPLYGFVPDESGRCST